MSLDMDRCWTEQPLVVVDFETCGLLPSDGACEVAAVRFEDFRIVDKFSTFLNQGKPIPQSATAVHSITDGMIAGAPALIEVAGDLLRVCRDAIPCAYSSDFDRGFLHASIVGKDCPAFDPEHLWLDPLVVIKDVDRFASGKGRHKLTETCKRWGVSLTNAHRAEGDAKSTGYLIQMLHASGKLPAMPLGKLLARIDSRRAAQEADFKAYLASQQTRASNGE